MAPEVDKEKLPLPGNDWGWGLVYSRAVRLSRPVLAAAAVLPLATLAPYLYGALATPPGRSFTWLHALNPGDPYTYLAWIQQGREGGLLFSELLTGESGRPVLFHPLFLAIGLVARVAGLSNMAAFHAARVLLGGILVALLYRLVGRFVEGRTARRATFLYLLVSGGLGWALLPAGAPLTAGAVDLWMPESSVFLSILESPLVVCAWGLLAAILLAAIPEEEAVSGGRVGGGGAPRRWLAIAGLALALGFVHPYEVVSLAAAFGAAVALGVALRWPRAAWGAPPLAALLAGAALPALYQALVVARDPIFGRYLGAANTMSPPPGRYVVAFLPSIVLGAFAAPRLLARRRPRDLLLLAWPAATAALVYAPVAVQRRFVLGVQIPLAILAGIGAFEVIGPALARRFSPRPPGGRPLARLPADGPAPLHARFPARFPARLPRPAGAALLAGVLAASALSNLTVVRADIEAYRRGGYPQYIPADLARAIRRFGEVAPRDAVLLSHPSVGYFVPGLTGRRVFAGHYDQTVDLAGKSEAIRAFFDAGTPDAARRAFLAGSTITHVLHSPVERTLGSVEPGALPYLEEVVAEGAIQILRVRREALAP